MRETLTPESHWAEFLGVPLGTWSEPGLYFVPHTGLGDYHGVWSFVCRETAVISSPAWLLPQLQQRLAAESVEDLLAPGPFEEVLGLDFDRAIGPSYQAWIPPQEFRPLDAAGVHPLQHSPGAASPEIAAFQAACPRQDWDHGGVDPAAGSLWCARAGTTLAALGQLREHSDGAVDPCVVCLPEFRGQGLAARLVSAMTAAALAEGKLVLYQTLVSNRPARRLADRLGFASFARLLAVRLSVNAAPSSPPAGRGE